MEGTAEGRPNGSKGITMSDQAILNALESIDRRLTNQEQARAEDIRAILRDLNALSTSTAKGMSDIEVALSDKVAASIADLHARIDEAVKASNEEAKVMMESIHAGETKSMDWRLKTATAIAGVALALSAFLAGKLTGVIP